MPPQSGGTPGSASYAEKSCVPFSPFSPVGLENLNVPVSFGVIDALLNQRNLLAARNASDAVHRMTSKRRSKDAVEIEIPTPVASATYAATHAGHLGSSANTAPGMSQPATSPLRRASLQQAWLTSAPPPSRTRSLKMPRRPATPWAANRAGSGRGTGPCRSGRGGGPTPC